MANTQGVTSGGGGGGGSAPQVPQAFEPTLKPSFSGGNLDFPVISDFQYETTGNVSNHTDQCGHTESDKNGTKGVNIKIEAIAYMTQVATLKQLDEGAGTVAVASNIHGESGLFVQDLKIQMDQDYDEFTESKTTQAAAKVTFQLKSSTGQSP